MRARTAGGVCWACGNEARCCAVCARCAAAASGFVSVLLQAARTNESARGRARAIGRIGTRSGRGGDAMQLDRAPGLVLHLARELAAGRVDVVAARLAHRGDEPGVLEDALERDD